MNNYKKFYFKKPKRVVDNEILSKEENRWLKGDKMNFIEAIKSGKRFRTKAMESSWLVIIGDRLVQEMCDDEQIPVNLIDIINCDFEIEERSITISESDFDLVYDKLGYAKVGGIRDNIKKALGF